jgi:phage terminase large subunit GpA-like protein
MAEVIRGFCRGLIVQEKLGPRAWAEKNIILPRAVSSMPGPRRFVSYQNGFLEALEDPSVEVIVLMTSAQVGKSELLSTIALYYMVADPSRILFVQPKDDAANEYKAERITPIIAESPALKEALKGYYDVREHDRIGYMGFPGGFVDFKGANSPTNLAGKPIRVLLMDEIDRYPGSVGGEGDPVNLGMKRTTTERSRKIILCSTPKDKARSRIERLYNQTDQKKFFVVCEHCTTEQTLEFDLESQNIQEIDGRGFCYACSECGTFWDQRELKQVVDAGYWKATADPQIDGWVGFHIWEAYSPFSSLKKIMQAWKVAEGDVAEEQSFWNTALGRPFEGKQFQRRTARSLLERREKINPDELPESLGALTAAVDVHGDRVEVLTMGWGVDDERWLIDVSRIYGDIRGNALWNRVTELLSRSFRHSTGEIMKIEAACFDVGFATQTVVDYVKRARAAFLNFYSVVGRAGEDKPLWPTTTRRNTDPGRIIALGKDEGSTELYMALANDEPGPGFVHINETITEEMLEQLVADICEEKVNKFGRVERTWITPKRKRNEVHDMAVYALAAFKSLGLNMVTRLEMLYGPAVPPVDVVRIARDFKLDKP